MNKQNDLMKIVCNETTKDRNPTFNHSEVTKTYDTSEIYDNPVEHMTIRGIFRYADVEVIA
jgi:hypothetical protein